MAARSGVIEAKGITDLHAEVPSEDQVVAPAHEVVQDSDMIADPSMPSAHADVAAEHSGDAAATSTEVASADDTGHAHADLAYADADHAYADAGHSYVDADHGVEDVDPAYADPGHMYADATVPDSAVAYADHSMLPADDGTPNSLGAGQGQGGDGHDYTAWWVAGGAALGMGGLGYLLAHDDDEHRSSSTAAVPDVHVVVESTGAWIDTNGDGVHQNTEDTAAVFQGSGASADLAANHVTIHFNDVPGGDNNDAGALNLTGFGADDKIEFHIEAMMGDNGGGRHILQASASYLSNLSVTDSHVSYSFTGGSRIEVHQHANDSISDFSGHFYDPLGGYLSVNNIASSIRVSSGYTTSQISPGNPSGYWAFSTSDAAIAYWSDTGNALNNNALLLPNTTASNHTAALNANNEGGVVDFIWPSATIAV